MIPQLHGRLQIECTTNQHQRTIISQQSVSTPFHLSKPYWNGRVLVIQVVNPTAGLFSGDLLESEVIIRETAKALITSPSASRVHASTGDRAELIQVLHIESGAWLEYSPSALIPHKDSRYRQQSDIHIARGGQLYWMEILAPGRCAHGESLEYQEVDWTCQIRLEGKLIGRERFILKPNNQSMYALRQPINDAWFASGFVYSDQLGKYPSILNDIRKLHSKDVLIGVSEMSKDFWTIRMLSAQPESLRRAIEQLRLYLSNAFPELEVQKRW